MSATALGRRVIGIFFRAPVAGRVKTRLSPPLTPEQAARLYEAFILDTIDCCRRAACADIVLFDGSAPGVEWQNAPPDLRRRVQVGSDLGERMSRAIEDLLDEGVEQAVLVGSDSPTLPPAFIVDAFHRLDRTDLVLGPASDGGYYLIGMRQRPGRLLSGIVWSTPTVLEETERNAASMGLTTARTEDWYDVDTFSDLERVRCLLKGGDAPWNLAPATRRALAGKFPN